MIPRLGKVSLASAIAIAAFCQGGTARASQFVLIDEVDIITGTGRYCGSKWFIPGGNCIANAADNGGTIPKAPPPASQPMSWLAPVDYTRGKLYLRVEVMTKPSTEKLYYEIILLGQTKDGKLCAPLFVRTPSFTAPGVFNFTVQLPGNYEVDKVDYSKPVKSLEIVSYVPDPKAAGGRAQVNGGSKYFPSKVRFSVTVVSPGDTYKPPPGVPSLQPPDGGVDARHSDGPPAADGPSGIDAAAADMEPAPATPTPPAPDATSVADARPAAPPVGGSTEPMIDDPASDQPVSPRRAGSGCALGDAGGAPPWMTVLLVALASWLVRRGRYPWGAPATTDTDGLFGSE